MKMSLTEMVARVLYGGEKPPEPDSSGEFRNLNTLKKRRRRAPEFQITPQMRWDAGRRAQSHPRD
jgi:hypothetical protein